jgi:hypothetical protein
MAGDHPGDRGDLVWTALTNTTNSTPSSVSGTIIVAVRLLAFRRGG